MGKRADVGKPGERAAGDRESGIQYLVREGWVYIIRWNDTCICKIGRSEDPEKRLKTIPLLKGMKRQELKIIHTIWTNDFYKLETEFHFIYRERKIKGEWYMLGEQDIKKIKRFRVVNLDTEWWAGILQRRDLFFPLFIGDDQRRFREIIRSNQ